jgi:hypothetical protein
MKQKNWHGIMKILEIQHLDSKNNVLWNAKNIYNLLHSEGEQFLLQAAFIGGRNSEIIPDFYYLGLDNRLTVTVSDTMADLISEPLGGGYERAEIASSGDFSINFDNNHYIATSPIVAFRATTGFWGPVSNLFLTAEVGSEFKLISTAVLPSAIILNSGDAVTMRIGMQIREIPQS